MYCLWLKDTELGSRVCCISVAYQRPSLCYDASPLPLPLYHHHPAPPVVWNKAIPGTVRYSG